MTRRKLPSSVLGSAAVAALSVGLAGVEDAAASPPAAVEVGPSVSEGEWSDGVERRRSQRAIRRLSEDSDPEIRRQAIERMAADGIDLRADTEDLLVSLATDPEPVVRRTIAVSLGRILSRLPMLDRYYLLASWATARQPELRWALACALCGPVASSGIHAALACLSVDPDPLVRRIAGQAARRRGLFWEATSAGERASSSPTARTEPSGEADGTTGGVSNPGANRR